MKEVDERHLNKHSVDAMHVVEMHMDQIHMRYTRVSWDLPNLSLVHLSMEENTYSNFDTWAADEGMCWFLHTFKRDIVTFAAWLRVDVAKAGPFSRRCTCRWSLRAHQ